MNNDIKVDLYSSDFSSESKEVSFIDTVIKAGFPSPAQDYLSGTIDLNRELIRHKETTFLARVSGNSLHDAGICDGDIIVIDKSLEAKNGDFVVAFVDGEFTLKYLRFREGGLTLVPANERYPSIEIGEGQEFMMWGVVTYVIKKVR